MRHDELTLIRALPLFADIDEASFDSLMHAAYFQRFPESVELITEGDVPDFLHVVVAGMVELTTAGNGRETVIEIVRPIETFILAAVVRDQPYLMSARTLDASRILMIPSRDVKSVFLNDTAFARAVVAELAGRYRGMVKALKNQKLRTSVERLANYLLCCSQQNGDSAEFRLVIEKRTLASLLGMTPENL
ncbi:MAG: cyclic nucleotide-binding domain-containing protein, partial [Bauldia sp.]|nr:cyclic nucleotide-binding domain-containing protein [Bauldia sp.]